MWGKAAQTYLYQILVLEKRALRLISLLVIDLTPFLSLSSSVNPVTAKGFPIDE